MAGVNKVKSRLLYHLGLNRFDLGSEPRRGVKRIKLADHRDVLLERVDPLGDRGRQCAKNAIHLDALFLEKHVETIIQLNRLFRLDIESRAGLAPVMEYPQIMTEPVGRDRNDISPVPLCDDIILPSGFLLLGAEDRVERADYASLVIYQVVADLAKFRGCIVLDIPFLIDRLLDVADNFGKGANSFEVLNKRRELGAAVLVVLMQRDGYFEKFENLKISLGSRNIPGIWPCPAGRGSLRAGTEGREDRTGRYPSSARSRSVAGRSIEGRSLAPTPQLPLGRTV